METAYAHNSLPSFVMYIEYALIIIAIVSMWKIFIKAHQPGWGAIIPVYSLYIMLKIVGRPWWWIFLMSIPVINIITWLVIAFDFARAFGQDKKFGFVGLFLFSFIGFPLLAFGDFVYKDPLKKK